jgi:hypothetical protein
MQVESLYIATSNEPAVKAYIVEMTEPTFRDLRSDATRLLDVLEKQSQKPVTNIDIDILRNISLNLRSGNWRRKAYVRQVDSDYFTDAIDYTQVKGLETFETAELGGAASAHGEVRVNRQIVGFKKVKFYTLENVGAAF